MHSYCERSHLFIHYGARDRLSNLCGSLAYIHHGCRTLYSTDPVQTGLAARHFGCGLHQDDLDWRGASADLPRMGRSQIAGCGSPLGLSWNSLHF